MNPKELSLKTSFLDSKQWLGFFFSCALTIGVEYKTKEKNARAEGWENYSSQDLSSIVFHQQTSNFHWRFRICRQKLCSSSMHPVMSTRWHGMHPRSIQLLNAKLEHSINKTRFVHEICSWGLFFPVSSSIWVQTSIAIVAYSGWQSTHHFVNTQKQCCHVTNGRIESHASRAIEVVSEHATQCAKSIPPPAPPPAPANLGTYSHLIWQK